MYSPAEITALNQELSALEPEGVLQRLHATVPRLALAFSGAEDVVLVHMAAKLRPRPIFLTLDTGRLHPETLSYIELIRRHYKIPLKVLHPNSDSLNKLIENKGLYSFFEDGHEECCNIRKVAPLAKALAGFDAWITGQRRDQSPNRQMVPVLELDPGFARPDRPLLKVNPLANWSSEQVWDYIRALSIPYNPLHDRGYRSIGCEPCTRATGPNQHEREGRWWWEEATVKECGLHRGKPVNG